MNIGLDWDNTFTKDYDLWQEFVIRASDRGHKVYITTSRSPDLELEANPTEIERIIFCSFRAKKIVTEEQGIKIDIWIDDDPEYINKGFVE